MNCIDDCPENALELHGIRARTAKQVFPTPTCRRRKLIFASAAGIIAFTPDQATTPRQRQELLGR
jgi:hypothetical protein